MVMTLGLFAAPAAAQDTTQEGLVNLAIGDVTLQVPIGVAANVCGVNAGVLASGEQTTDPVCKINADEAQQLSWTGNGGGDVDQQGLVNVALGDVTLQVPIGIAANICGLNVAVLASGEQTTDPACVINADEAQQISWTGNRGQGHGHGGANAPGQNR
jgi:hypothetical protein